MTSACGGDSLALVSAPCLVDSFLALPVYPGRLFCGVSGYAGCFLRCGLCWPNVYLCGFVRLFVFPLFWGGPGLTGCVYCFNWVFFLVNPCWVLMATGHLPLASSCLVFLAPCCAITLPFLMLLFCLWFPQISPAHVALGPGSGGLITLICILLIGMLIRLLSFPCVFFFYWCAFFSCVCFLE